MSPEMPGNLAYALLLSVPQRDLFALREGEIPS